MVQPQTSETLRDNNLIHQCADDLSALGCVKSAEQLSLMANLLAISITEGKSADQLDVLGNFISAVGDLISLISSQIHICESKQDKIKQIQDLKKQIKNLEDNL